MSKYECVKEQLIFFSTKVLIMQYIYYVYILHKLLIIKALKFYIIIVMRLIYVSKRLKPLISLKVW
jgi:hypothetical protein